MRSLQAQFAEFVALTRSGLSNFIDLYFIFPLRHSTCHAWPITERKKTEPSTTEAMRENEMEWMKKSDGKRGKERYTTEQRKTDQRSE
eukprot:scaffold264826_cov47-Prasinocladus_malaysianus.AAC.2